MPMCQDTYDQATITRAKYPLRTGMYKIREGLRNLESVRATIEKIAKREKDRLGYRHDEVLGCCLAFERSTFLKNIPKNIAFDLAYTIEAGVGALGGDGVSEAKVAQLKASAETKVKPLIATCDALHNHLKSGIKSEYDAMKNGRSQLLDLRDDAIDFVKVHTP